MWMKRDEKRSVRVSGGLRPCVDEIVGPCMSRRPMAKRMREGVFKRRGSNTPKRDKTIACVNLAWALDNGDSSPSGSS